ncbi:MAG: SRPBCC family protein [Candidatus Heimdallarchaeota archaeon]|nr:SRPBCC family protein [Candidatus Heimdallarchaeota archaeon]
MKVHIETDINASADKVWKILAHDFVDVAHWSSIVKESRIISRGDLPADAVLADQAPVIGRATKTRAGEFYEYFTEFSDEKKEFTFEGANMPRMMISATNNSKIITKGDNSCVVSFDVTMQFKGIFKIFSPLIERRVSRSFGRVQRDLKTFAEMDKPVIS